MTKAEREQLDKAMKLIQELTEIFREDQPTQDCAVEDSEAARLENDRQWGDDIKNKFHRTGSGQSRAERKVNDRRRVGPTR